MDTSPQKNTYIFDPYSPAELARLINQHRFLTQAMGGPLAGLPALPQTARILDIACGPGSWVLDVAFALPQVEVAGIDISQAMIDYANARAHSQGRTNASFGVMDITKPLDFADATFDLINSRFLVGVLKRDAWLPFLKECTRLLRPGGILRLSEPDDGGTTNSPTFESFSVKSIQALWRAGYGFSMNGRTFGMVPALLRQMKSLGYRDMHLSAAVADYSHDSDGWSDYYHNNELTAFQLKALFLAQGLFTHDEFDQQYQRLLDEMRDIDFTATWHFTTLWDTAFPARR